MSAPAVGQVQPDPFAPLFSASWAAAFLPEGEVGPSIDERIASFIDGRMTGDERSAIAAHLAASPEDRRVFLFTAELVRQMKEEEPVSAADVRERVHDLVSRALGLPAGQGYSPIDYFVALGLTGARREKLDAGIREAFGLEAFDSQGRAIATVGALVDAVAVACSLRALSVARALLGEPRIGDDA